METEKAKAVRSLPKQIISYSTAFVDIAIAVGFQVPHNHTFPFNNVYPPAANDWALGRNLGDWVYLGQTYPEPGFIAGRSVSGNGHCGIVDYDGWVIGVRPDGIGRRAKRMLDGTCGYSKPKGE